MSISRPPASLYAQCQRLSSLTPARSLFPASRSHATASKRSSPARKPLSNIKARSSTSGGSMTVKSRPTPTSSTSSARKPRKSPLDFTTSESSSRAPPSSLEETGLSEFSHELSTVQESVDNKNTRGSPNSNSSSSSIETSAEQLVQALEEAIVSGDSVLAWKRFQAFLSSAEQMLTFSLEKHLYPLLELLVNSFDTKDSLFLHRIDIVSMTIKAATTEGRARRSEAPGPSFYNTLLRAYSLAGNEEKLMTTWQDLSSSVTPSTSSYNSIISFYLNKQQRHDVALDYFGQIKLQGLSPDTETYSLLLQSCIFRKDFVGAELYWQHLNSLIIPTCATATSATTTSSSTTSTPPIDETQQQQHHQLSIIPVKIHEIMMDVWISQGGEEKLQEAVRHVKLLSIQGDTQEIGSVCLYALLDHLFNVKQDHQKAMSIATEFSESTSLLDSKCLKLVLTHLTTSSSNAESSETGAEENLNYACRMLYDYLERNPIASGETVVEGKEQLMWRALLSSPSNVIASGENTSSLPYLDLFDLVLKRANELKLVSLAEEIVLNMKRNFLEPNISIMETLVELHVRNESIDLAFEVFMNYKMNFGQSIDQEIPTKVYNLLLAGLASSYRMTEFANMYEDMKSQGSADASSHYIAFESYMSVKDAMRAYQVCGTIIDSSQPSSLSSASSTATSSRSTTMLKPSVESLLDLFELIVVSKMYDACSKVLGWIRRVSALESVEERRRVGQLIQVRVEPLVGSMQKDIRGSLSSSSSDVSDASIGDSSDEADGRWRAIEDKKRNALLLFEEFVAHDISLPDSVYIAVMKYFHSTHNMVGIAKTWAALDKRAKKGHHQQQQQQGVGNPNQQSQPPTPHQIKARLPSEECVQVFLAASRDLCGARSGKSVLKLVRMEHLSLNKESYLSLLALSARHGWIDEIIQLFIEMSTRNPDSSTGNNHSTSYLTPEVFGHVDSMLANNKHRRKRKQLTEFMEESFPEVVGLWFENVDSDLNKQLESIRNLRL